MLIALVILVVVILVVSIVAYLLIATAPAPAVQIGEIVIWTPDNACGLLANPIYFYGYNASTSENDTLQLYGWENYNATSCTIVGVTTNTTGFVVYGVGLPVTIPGGDMNASVNVTVLTPSSSFSGTLNLVFS